jgi:molecular chaperone DnaK
MAEKLYAEKQAGGAAGSTEGGAGKPGDDGVVDAEFEEVKGDDEKKSA